MSQRLWKKFATLFKISGNRLTTAYLMLAEIVLIGFISLAPYAQCYCRAWNSTARNGCDC